MRYSNKKRTLTYKNAVLSKCKECMNDWIDGKKDCEVPDCPLYSYQPYRKQEPEMTWLDDNPRRIGA